MCQREGDRRVRGRQRSLSIILAHSSVSIDSMRYNIVYRIWHMVICKAHLANDSYRFVALTRTKTYKKQQQQIVKKKQQKNKNITKRWKKQQQQQQKHPKRSIVGLAKAFSDVARSRDRSRSWCLEEYEAKAEMLSWSWEAEKNANWFLRTNLISSQLESFSGDRRRNKITQGG